MKTSTISKHLSRKMTIWYTELCNEEQITKYVCIFGQLQWTVTLGRYDTLAHVITMSRFSLAPQIEHLERLKRLYG